MMEKRVLRLALEDNVGTALVAIGAGEKAVACFGEHAVAVTALEAIPAFFKIAVEDIPEGNAVRKYGEPIGIAVTTICRGSLVHIHNLAGARGRGDCTARGPL